MGNKFKETGASLVAAAALGGAAMVEGGEMPETETEGHKIEQVSETHGMSARDFYKLREDMLKQGATDGEIEGALMDAAFSQMDGVQPVEEEKTEDVAVVTDERNGFERGVDATVDTVNDVVKTGINAALLPGRFVLYLGDEAVRYLAKGINELGKATGTEPLTNPIVDGVLSVKDTAFGVADSAVDGVENLADLPFDWTGELAKSGAKMTRDPVEGAKEFGAYATAPAVNAVGNTLMAAGLAPMAANALIFTTQDGVRRALVGPPEMFAKLVGSIDAEQGKKMQEMVDAGNGALALKNMADFLAGQIASATGMALAVTSVTLAPDIIEGYLAVKNGKGVLTEEEKAFMKEEGKKVENAIKTAMEKGEEKDELKQKIEVDGNVEIVEAFKNNTGKEGFDLMAFLSDAGKIVSKTDAKNREEKLNTPKEMPTIKMPEKESNETPMSEEEKAAARTKARIIAKELGAMLAK